MKLEDELKHIYRILDKFDKILFGNGKKGLVEEFIFTKKSLMELEEYKKDELEPMVKAFSNQQAVKKYTLKQKAFKWSLAMAFGVAAITAVWNAGYWAFQKTIDGIVEKENQELVQKIEELNIKLNDLEFNINIEDF